MNYKNSAISEPDDHGLGRSRGGLTTKLHALTDTATCPVAMLLTAGQAGDNPQLLPLVDGYFRTEQTSDGARDVRLLADKAYSHPSTRTALRRRGIKHTIPERDDQIARRKAKGSAGGRPPAFHLRDRFARLPHDPDRAFPELSIETSPFHRRSLPSWRCLYGTRGSPPGLHSQSSRLPFD